uniref:Fe2OG dioxygenase domain-containing protein n=1 Tax=Arcella intermedia TaxID=1963864 RepID=A0A6B2L9R6_9EUKA
MFCKDVKEDNPAVSKIKDALENIGFFYISNHGLNPEELQSSLELSRTFFRLPTEVKKKSARSSVVNSVGYVEIGVENLDDYDPKLTDLKEAMDITVNEPHPFYSHNNWPSEEALPHWKEGVKELFIKLEKIGNALVTAFAVALGEKADFLSSWYIPTSNSLVRLLRYPPTPPEESGTIGCGAHSDYGLATLLIQDAVGGLQILYKDKWIDATPIPGTLVINVGDCMEYLTNGAFKATKHRVINKSSEVDRHVCLMFYEPDYNMPMTVVERFKDRPENLMWPRTATFGEHLQRRLGATYTFHPNPETTKETKPPSQ